MNEILIQIFYFIFCVIFSYGTNYLFLKFSKSLGVRNNEELDQVRWTKEVKPSLGGLSFFLIFLISISFIGFISNSGEMLVKNQQFIGILAATTLGFIIGLADDSYNTNPLVKFIGQLTCAFILIFANVYIVATGNYAIDYLITIFWVVGLMNSINMLDNMDAITTTTSMVILGAALFYISTTPFQTSAITLLILGVLAALSGFLFLNWHPAKIYMGDTGSQFLGVFLAAISILLFWNERDNVSGIIQIKQFVLPLLIFTVPLMDTLTVFIRRILRKQSPFVGGKDHTTHQLVFFGFTQRQTALVLIIIGTISSTFALFLKMSIIPWNFTTSLLAFAYFFVVFGIMQIVYNIGKKKHESA
jgi:UDP-GlcNAc:undecaprenyl-phosphate GlcNAc-1-phosphate transferase